MQIHTITPVLIDQGRAVFELGKSCGLAKGFSIVPGAIIAAIENGLVTAPDIERTVSLYSRCRATTVATVLESLSTNVNSHGLWGQRADGSFHLVDQPVVPFTILAG